MGWHTNYRFKKAYQLCKTTKWWHTKWNNSWKWRTSSKMKEVTACMLLCCLRLIAPNYLFDCLGFFGETVFRSLSWTGHGQSQHEIIIVIFRFCKSADGDFQPIHGLISLSLTEIKNETIESDDSFTRFWSVDLTWDDFETFFNFNFSISKKTIQ